MFENKRWIVSHRHEFKDLKSWNDWKTYWNCCSGNETKTTNDANKWSIKCDWIAYRKNSFDLANNWRLNFSVKIQMI